MSTWTQVRDALTGVGLPLLGNALLPGSGTAITLVESALEMAPGTATPDAVVAAGANPDGLLKLKALENQHSELLAKMGYDYAQSAAKTEADEAASARNLAQIDISHGNALTSFLSAVVRPAWGIVCLGVFVYAVVWKVPLDPMAHDVMDTILKFYFGGKIIEAITPHVTEMVATFGRR